VTSTAERTGVPSGTLERGLSVLEYFARVGEAAASDAVTTLGISRSATYRILDTLQRRGYLEINPASEKLRLGMRTAELGMAAVSGIDAVRLAPPYLHGLVEKTLETVFLAVMDNSTMVYVYREEGPQAVKMSSRIGSRRPLHCTALGKAYMSALSDGARRTLISELDLRRFTANTITDAAALEAEVLATRERGYGVDRVEVEEGVACFGAPVRDHRGLPVAAISVAGPAERILPREGEVGPLVAETALEISRRLGYVDLSDRP
jgi:IclR family transcriptional regulator, acetate operon repressor